MMFGRRRRNARLIQAQAPEPVVPALSDERVFELVHGSLSELIGVRGDWTLVPRQAEDTDEIFHGMKAQQIAALLTRKLAEARDAVRESVAAVDSATTDAASPVSVTSESISAETATIQTSAEPAALPWSPVPISVWAEPEHDHAEHDHAGQKPRLVA